MTLSPETARFDDLLEVLAEHGVVPSLGHTDTTAAAPNLLRVLTETSDTCMGVYCRVLRQGSVKIGDLVGPE